MTPQTYTGSWNPRRDAKHSSRSDPARTTMSDRRPMYTCPTCTSTYTSPWAASYCCDNDYDMPNFERGYD